LGDGNLLIGLDISSNLISDANGDLQYAAVQKSLSGDINELIVEQVNPITQNQILLYQEAFEKNEGRFIQSNGSHTLMLKQISSAGTNISHITQLEGSGFINLEQKAYSNNTIPLVTNSIMDNPFGYSGIYQEGESNFIYGAAEVYDTEFELVAVPAPDLPAQQISETGSNWLEIWQTGGNNVVALHQEAVADNTALIRQFDGFNIAVIYQKGAGFNNIKVEQFGGAEAYIYQNGGGHNYAVIEQH